MTWTDHLVLDCGDGQPRAVTGQHVTRLEVAALWALYGVKALVRHPALEPVRSPVLSVS